MGAEEVWLAAWASGGRSKEEEERKQNKGEETLRWIKLRSMGGCMSSKANVDTTIRSVGTPRGNMSCSLMTLTSVMWRVISLVWLYRMLIPIL